MPDDNDFMWRVACVMSDHGNQMDENGGIWQLSKTAFEDTMITRGRQLILQKYERIWLAYGIDWKKVKYKDLKDPFLSALAARLYLSNFEEPIPPPHKVSEQAQYWYFLYMRGEGEEGEMLMFEQKTLGLSKY